MAHRQGLIHGTITQLADFFARQRSQLGTFVQTTNTYLPSCIGQITDCHQCITAIIARTNTCDDRSLGRKTPEDRISYSPARFLHQTLWRGTMLKGLVFELTHFRTS